jgi:hypothetical protein
MAAGMTGGGCAVLAGRRGVERPDGMFAKRKMLAASCAEDRKHGAEDARACLAEQCAARRRARQYRGSFSGRRRWRSVARLAGKYPRMVEFHDTILHPHAQALVPQHSGTRISVLPFFAWKLVRTLPLRPRTACLCGVSTIIGKVVDNCTARLCSGLAAAILRSCKAVSNYRV